MIYLNRLDQQLIVFRHWVSHIVARVPTVLCLGIKESKASQLLEAKVCKLRKETGYESFHADDGNRQLAVESFNQDNLFRPLQFLFTEPLVWFRRLQSFVDSPTPVRSSIFLQLTTKTHND